MIREFRPKNMNSDFGAKKLLNGGMMGFKG